MRKILALLLSAVLLLGTLAACGSGDTAETTDPGAQVSGKTSDAYEVTSDVDTSGYQKNTELDLETPVTLDIYGPGLFAAVGEDGVTDLTSGIFKPGYSEIITRWNELYPNVTLKIEGCSWDSWQSSITTACLSGDIDVIMHGATMTDLTLDLASYLKADPDYADSIYATASRRTTDNPSQYKVSGISLTLSPAVVWLDTQIFKDYGVDLPSDDWTYDDVLEIAAQLTGTDPVTGTQTYGLQMFAAGTANLWFNYTQTANALGAKVFTYGATLADCTVNYMSDESVAAFQLIADMAQFASPSSKEDVSVSAALNGTNDWAMLFNEGPIASYFEMKAAGLDGRYVAVNLPVVTEGDNAGNPTPHSGDNNMAVYKDSDAADWAWEFIKFMTTDETATQWVVDTLNYPNNVDGKAYVEELIGDELTSVMDKAFSTLPDNYNNATNDVFNNVSFGSVTNTQITAVDNVINGYMTAQEAAQSMQDYVDEYLNSLG